jgi:sugar phosphate isomerase/epimerase/glyoxylase-like metal-dependent hydrolase (beta-lactamase superfamily II)
MSPQPPREIYFSFFMFTADLQPNNQEYRQVLVRHMHKLDEMGYNGFDLHIADRPASDFDYKKEVEDYRGLKQAFDKEGFTNMKFATNVGSTRDYDPTSPSPETRELALLYLKSRVDITKVLGGEGAIMSGPFLYPYGAFPDKPLWSDSLQDWIQPRLRNADSVFKELAHYADENKVKLALEPVKNWETPPPNMVSEVLDFVERLQSKPCGITIDTAQVLMESQGPQIFRKNVDRAANRGLLNYVHISPPDRGDLYDSWIPWDLMLGKLEEPTSPSARRFQGPYLIEIFNAIPPFDALMRMSRRRFWRPGEDPNGSEELNAYRIAYKAFEELRRQIDRVRSASVSGDTPRVRETSQRHETGLRPETVPGKVNLGMKSSQADPADDLPGDDAHGSPLDDAESFPFIVRSDHYGGLYNAVRIHTFIASYTDNNIANATHIVESANALVVVDGQFLAPYARQFRAYAARLNKTIERVYLSHRHPDHWFGIPTAFSDQIVYALPDTIKWVKDNGKQSLENHVERLKKQLGEHEAKVLVPTTHQFTMEPIKPHEETIDGVKYVFEEESDAEVETQLTIKLPEIGVAIVQDLIYSGTHLYLSKTMNHWRRILQKLAQSDYKTFLPGHGGPADKEELRANIEYLIAAQRVFSDGKSKDELHKYLLDRYPGRLCQGIFPIYLPRLYGEAGEV